MMGRLMERLFKNSRKRILATALAVLTVCSMVPMVWTAVSAAGAECGIEEHSHTDGCYEPACTLTEGEQYGSHAHGEGCFAQKTVCECAEGDEHTEACYAEELVCTLEEGDHVLLGEHSHAQDCYTLICEKTEHAHTEECGAAWASDSDVRESGSDVKESDSDAEESVALTAVNSEEKTVFLANNTELSVSGVWDVGDAEEGHENIAFGSDETATIEHGSSYHSEEVSVRITAAYPSGATDLKLKIELAEGLEWVSNGENSILASALASVSSQQGKSRIYGSYLNNGYYTYSFNEGVESVSVTIRVKKSSATNFASITDSIKATATCTENGESLSGTSSLKKLECGQFSHIGYVNNRLDKTVKAEEVAYNYGFLLHSYYSGSGVSHHRLYDYAEVTVTAPKGVILNNPDVNHSGSGGISDVVVNGWYLVSADDSAEDVTKYTMRVDGIYNQAIGSTFEWIFPEELAGQTVPVIYSNMKWKLYGDDTVYTLNKTRETYFTIVSSQIKINEIVESKDVFAELAFDPQSPEAVYLLGGLPICNMGSDPSVPKVVEIDFDDENIGVTNITLLLPSSGMTTVKVWYKVHGDDTWYEKSVTKDMYRDETITSLGMFKLSNLDLGLSADTYLSALKYEYDYLADDNGTPDDPTDDVRIGIPANRRTGGYSNPAAAFYPIAGVNLGLSAENPTAISTFTIRDKYDDGTHAPLNHTITTTYSEKLENHMYLAGETVWDEKAGDSFTVSAQINTRWNSNSSAAYTVGFTHYPIIYIRDETGEGISNIRLVNNQGVDVISRYPDNISVTLDHTETVDHNGDGKLAKVYKIDTTGLSSLSAKEDRYAAAVGAWDSSAEKAKLTLSYTIHTPGIYDDGGIAHKLVESIFLSDPHMSSRTIKSGETRTDPYDVDGDGVIAGERDIMQALNQMNSLTSEYTIAPSADITVATAAKKADGSGYVTWDGSDSYVQIQSGEEYDVRNSIYNGAGVTTSTEDGKKTIVYIPVPKKGQQWGQANSGVDKDGNALTTFAYDMTLSGAVNNPAPDVFTISYGNVSTGGFSASDTCGVIGQKINSSSTAWSSSYSDSANCVRIIVSGMEPSESLAKAMHFIMPLKADESANNREVNIFSAIFYEDITNVNGDNYKMWKNADRMALQIAEGEVSGRLWEDLNGNGIQDEGEPGMKDMTVTLVGDLSFPNPVTTTDENGEYRFTKLPLCEYYLSFSPDFQEYFISEKNVGSSTKLDSDAVAVYNDEYDQYVGAHIEGIVIPSTDSLGRQTYVVENMDAGLVPYINVGYAWEGATAYDVPAGAEFPVATGKILAGTAYTAGAVTPFEGYTFDGWYTDYGFSRKYVDGTVLTEDITLRGRWSANASTITFDSNGGSDVAPIVSRYTYPVTSPADPTREGYTFRGWDKEIPAAMPLNSMTITAQWEINQYTITFDTDGGTAIAPVTQDYGTAVTAPADPAKTGYTFKGWDREIPSAMPAEDVTITALWEINRFDVVYNVVGTRPVKAVVPENDIVDYSTAYTAKIPAAISGYTFDGWYTDEECTNRFVDGTSITGDIDLYGGWSRNLVTVSGVKTWVENGEGFVRPDSIIIELYRDEILLDSAEIAKDEAAETQTYTFEGLYETDEEGNVYVYTVSEQTVPDKYVSVVAGYDITNTYNVDTFIISKSWDNTGNPDEIPESVDVELYCDDTLYQTVTLSGANGWSQTVTVSRLSAEGHTFTIREIVVPGFSTAYETPAAVDTDGDDVADTITYVISNTYIMPKITVSGDIAWDKIPEGMTEPEIKVNLMAGDEVIDTVTIPAGVSGYSFDGLDRYDDEGNVIAYTIKVDDIADYDAVTTEPTTDDDGNITIDITATGTFAYGTLTISNTVIGEGAPADAEFVYTVTFDSAVSYPYTGSAAGTIRSGDKLTLKAGESITIADILVGVKFTVGQDKVENFVTAPSGGKIEGVISSAASLAEFTNKFELPPVGNLEITNKVTGDKADRTLKFPFKVEFDAEGSYELRIFGAGETVPVNTAGVLGGMSISTAAGARATVTTIKSGDTVQLAHGETAVIYGLPAGAAYKVTETDTKGYKLTSTGAAGTVAEDGSRASFINEKIDKVAGSTDGPDTGDHGSSQTDALLVMQLAVMSMLVSVFCMKKLSRLDERRRLWADSAE